MGIKFEQLEESSVICLEGAVDISSAAELKTTLLDAVKPGRTVRISLDRCTGLDVTVIQLLLAAGRQARASAVSFAFTGPLPEPLSATLKDAGFEPFPITD